VALWIGPEGGFTDRERRVLNTRDVVPVSFGPRVLRSETAGIAAVTAAQLILGDL
jgi:16S rRNA (uracil1498-N3)-methyltransferase